MSQKRKESRYASIARALAEGKTIKEAMLSAGYEPKTAEVGMIKDGRRLVSPWKHPNILALVEEIREIARARTGLKTQDIVERLERARLLAMKNVMPAAAVSATMGQAKTLGLIVERKQVELKPIEEMTESELRRLLGESAVDQDEDDEDEDP